MSIKAVLATTKIPNLKANHNNLDPNKLLPEAVLATTKIPNLKANHNKHKVTKHPDELY